MKPKKGESEEAKSDSATGKSKKDDIQCRRSMHKFKTGKTDESNPPSKSLKNDMEHRSPLTNSRKQEKGFQWGDRHGDNASASGHQPRSPREPRSPRKDKPCFTGNRRQQQNKNFNPMKFLNAMNQVQQMMDMFKNN